MSARAPICGPRVGSSRRSVTEALIRTRSGLNAFHTHNRAHGNVSHEHACSVYSAYSASLCIRASPGSDLGIVSTAARGSCLVALPALTQRNYPVE